MPTLNPADINRLRMWAGDLDPKRPDVPDSDVAAYWSQTNGNLPETMILILRHRMGSVMGRENGTGINGASGGGSEFDRIAKTLLPYWERQAQAARDAAAGAAPGGFVFGALGLGIDEPARSENGEW